MEAECHSRLSEAFAAIQERVLSRSWSAAEHNPEQASSRVTAPSGLFKAF